MTPLRELTYGVTTQLDAAFRGGNATFELEDYEVPFARSVDLEPLSIVLDEAMERYSDRPARSDSWLGPRVHDALRLTRSEAARRGPWLYLAIAFRPDYVRWRWGGESEDAVAKVERFAGPDYKHAYARLWWMAEIFRNGADYAPAAKALENQDIVNNLFRMDIAHHRPTVLGAIAVLFPTEGKPLTGRHANALAKAANAAATTLQFEFLATDAGPDEAATRLWLDEAKDVDVRAHFDQLPEGPQDAGVGDEALSAMKGIMEVLMGEAPVRGKAKEDELAEEEEMEAVSVP